MIDIKKANSIEKIIEGLPGDAVIGEFAGRDSVAAIIKALEDDSINSILPVASFSPTEYGDFKILESNYLMMVNRIRDLYGNKKVVFPLVCYSNFDLWSLINGRFVNSIIKKFGFYSPCIGCHAYLHLLRVMIGVKLGKKVICGERESHDGRIKINQASHSIDTYVRIARHFNVELLTPLRYMKDGDQVESLIGWYWQEGKGHQSCAFSGNYSDIKVNVTFDESKLKAYLDEYIYPVCIMLGDVILQNENATKIEMMDKLSNYKW
jgi:hypothetical protein